MKWGPPSTPAVCTGLRSNSFMLRVLDIHMRSLSEEVNQTQCIISGLEAVKQSIETSWAEAPAPGIEAGLSESTQSPPGTKWHVGSLSLRASCSQPLQGEPMVGLASCSGQPSQTAATLAAAGAQLYWSHPCTLGTSSLRLASISIVRVQTQPGFTEALVQAYFPCSQSGLLYGTLCSGHVRIRDKVM